MRYEFPRGTVGTRKNFVELVPQGRLQQNDGVSDGVNFRRDTLDQWPLMGVAVIAFVVRRGNRKTNGK